MLGAFTSASVRGDLIGWEKLDHCTRKFEGVEHLAPIWKVEDLIKHSVHEPAASAPCSPSEDLRVWREKGEPCPRTPG